MLRREKLGHGWRLIVFPVLAIAPWIIPIKPANADPPEGFVPLFNGKDLSSWRGLAADPKERAKMSADELAIAQKAADEKVRAQWRAVDGVIECRGGHDNICTVKDFGNFELYVDWKIPPNGDSGIYVRGIPQIQIWDPADKSVWQYGADKGSGGMWNNTKHSRDPLVKADRPAGEWNTFYIKMVGDRVTVKLNDQLVVDNEVMENYWFPDTPLATKGPIELQSHGNKVWFRNIYLRELPD